MIHTGARARARKFVIGYCSMARMIQILFKLILCVLLAIGAGFCLCRGEIRGSAVRILTNG